MVTRAPVQPAAVTVSPHLRELEESFVSSLGWGLHRNFDQENRFAKQVSEALGLAPEDLAYPECRDVFVAIRDEYLRAEHFTWQAVRRSLWQSGWFEDHSQSRVPSPSRRSRHTIFIDIVCDQFTTVGALPELRRLIEAEAASRRGETFSARGYQ